MNRMTRREWHRRAFMGLAAALPAARSALSATPKPSPSPKPTPTPKPLRIDPRIKHVTVGIHSRCFQAQTLEEAVGSMRACGFGACELWHGHLEPKDLRAADASREDLRRFRLELATEKVLPTRRLFEQAGIGLLALNLDLRSDFTDAEIERGFATAQDLGVRLITATSDRSVLTRLPFFAHRYGIRVALANAAGAVPGEIASPDDLVAAAAQDLGAFRLCPDAGHLAAGGHDPLALLDGQHQRMPILRLRDRARDGGTDVPWGTGTAPLGELLRRIDHNRWPVAAVVAFDGAVPAAIEQARQCLAFCGEALGA
jgi:sugar phosphate isomerase/epimerase